MLSSRHDQPAVNGLFLPSELGDCPNCAKHSLVRTSSGAAYCFECGHVAEDPDDGRGEPRDHE